MKNPRHGTGAVGLGDRLYVLGGADKQGFGAVDTNEAFFYPVLGWLAPALCRLAPALGWLAPAFTSSAPALRQLASGPARSG